MKGQKLNMKEIFQEIPELESPPLKKRGTKRNKTAGARYEYEKRDMMKAIGYPHVVTCTVESKNRDAQKIDLMNKDEHINGVLEHSIQCKNSSQIIDYVKIFKGYKKKVVLKRTGKSQIIDVCEMPSIPGTYRVILHKKTKKVNQPIDKTDLTKGFKEIFIPEGEFAIMPQEDWLKLITELKRLRETYEP